MIMIFDTLLQNGDISRYFFCFSKFSFFGLSGGKKAKNSPKRKITITSVTHQILGTYIIWSSFMVHLYKMTSPGFFSFLKKYDSLGCYAGGSQKMLQMRKILLHSVSLKSYIKWFSVMILMCKMISPWTFSIFSKFWFGGLLGCVKGQK